MVDFSGIQALNKPIQDTYNKEFGLDLEVYNFLYR